MEQDNTITVKDVISKYKPKSWENVFDESVNELNFVSEILEKEEATYGRFYPNKRDIFKAFELTPLNEVRVVIVGQDPYHQWIGKPRATGLSFSVSKDDEVPVSLKNIYKELSTSIKDFKIPNHGDLTKWAKQGILMLNSCLTVRANTPDSHGEIWHGFISNVCKAITSTNPYCIYVLWGKKSQNLRKMIGDRSIVLEAAHPSGFSANHGFFGCGHFKKINEILITQNKPIIDWDLLDDKIANKKEADAVFKLEDCPQTEKFVQNLYHPPAPETLRESNIQPIDVTELNPNRISERDKIYEVKVVIKKREKRVLTIPQVDFNK